MQDVYANTGGALSARLELVGEGQCPDKMQGHWVLARAGKRVLRPGGLQLTRRMLDALAINSFDRVVEFAPGLGVTARMVLDKCPRAYCAVEREPAAAEYLRRKLAANNAQIVPGQAQESGLPAACASVVFGEAMLSMQTQEQKNRIIVDARRLLAPGGRYAIHELCFLPDGISDHLRRDIQAAMSSEIHVGVQPLSRNEWVSLFVRNELTVTWVGETPMHLLEPRRVLRDEGVIGGLRMGLHMLTNAVPRQRILAMRRLFRNYEKHLGAIAMVGVRQPGAA